MNKIKIVLNPVAGKGHSGRVEPDIIRFFKEENAEFDLVQTKKKGHGIELARQAVEEGYNVVPQKWIETGSTGFSKDISTILNIMGRRKDHYRDYLKEISPYTLKLPASPHLAAMVQNMRISENKIKK